MESYTQRACQNWFFMNKIIDRCGCFPSYDELYKALQLNQKVKSPPCTFFEHATCVAKMKNVKDLSEWNSACLPACDHTSIHQESVLVRYIYIVRD